MLNPNRGLDDCGDCGAVVGSSVVGDEGAVVSVVLEVESDLEWSAGDGEDPVSIPTNAIPEVSSKTRHTAIGARRGGPSLNATPF
jgi:hypothetical protein